MVRNISQICNYEKKIKEENDRRVKTAQVFHIRSLLKSRNESARKQIHQRNLNSAIHARAYSLN